MSDKENLKLQYPLDDNSRDMNRDTIYHYSREHRLKSAPANVQEIYQEKPGQTGLFKNMARHLVGAGNTRLLVFIIILSLIAFSLSNRLQSNETGIKLGGNSIAVSIIAEEEVLIFDLVKSAPQKGSAYTGVVDIAVSPILPGNDEGDTMAPIYTHRIFFTAADSETFQMVIPFDGKNFHLLLKTSSEEKSFNISVSN